MHSTLVRAQNVFGFFTTVAFFTALLTALSVLFTPQNPSASIEVRNVQVYVYKLKDRRIRLELTCPTESKAGRTIHHRKEKNMRTSNSISTPVGRKMAESQRDGY